MLASVLSVIIAIFVFFKFEKHRFRSLYAGVICAVCLPIFTAAIFAITTFFQSVGVQGFINDSLSLVVSALLAPVRQLTGGEASPSVVFPGWLMGACLFTTAIRLAMTAKSNQKPNQ